MRLLLIFSQARPCRVRVPFNDDGALAIGRTHIHAVALDRRLSRRHASIEIRNDRWMVRDLGSRNGTWVDRRRLEGPYLGRAPLVIRCGDSLFVPEGGRAGETALAIFQTVRACLPPARAAPSLVEECLLRPWPGGLLELEREVRAACQCAAYAGGSAVFAEHLARRAGKRAGHVDTPSSPL